MGFKNIFSLFSCYYKLFCAVLASLARCLQYTPQARCKCRRNYSLSRSWSRVRVPSLPHQWQSSSEVEHEYFVIPCCNVCPFRANAGWFTGRATADAVGLGFKSRWRANAIAQAQQPANLVAHLSYGLWRNRQMPKELQPITHGSRVRVPSLLYQWQSSSAG